MLAARITQGLHDCSGIRPHFKVFPQPQQNYYRMDKKQHIVITGVTRGLGRALTETWAADGHTVCGCGRNAGHIAELREAFPDGCHFQTLDVCDRKAVDAWAQEVLGAFGPPDFLVNNAAVIHRNNAIWEIPPEEFDQVIDVNIKGLANVTRAFLPAMLEREQGVVVNLSSGAGRAGFTHIGGYCTSKWAVEGFSKSLAHELPDGMACVPLSPGVIDTDMLRSSFGDSAAHQPKPTEWACSAAPYILQLGQKDNGKSLTVPY